MSFEQRVLFLTCSTQNLAEDLKVYVFPDQNNPNYLWICRASSDQIIVECALGERGPEKISCHKDIVLDDQDRELIVDCYIDVLQHRYGFVQRAVVQSYFLENIFNEDGFYLLSEQFQQNLAKLSSAPTAVVFRPVVPVRASRASEPSSSEPSNGILALAPTSATV